MTLVEVSISMLVLVVAVGGTLGSISGVVGLDESSRETTIAYLAAQQSVEELATVDFRQVFARFNDDDADDVAGVENPGSNFTVDGLTPQAGDPDGLAGRILFPVSVASPTVLREDLVDPDFGMPQDLNADNAMDALDHASDYEVLPVRIIVEWRGRSGNRAIELQTLLRAR